MNPAELAELLAEVLRVPARQVPFARLFELAPRAVAMLKELGWDPPAPFPCDPSVYGPDSEVGYYTALNLPVIQVAGSKHAPDGRPVFPECPEWVQHVEELRNRALLRAEQTQIPGGPVAPAAAAPATAAIPLDGPGEGSLVRPRIRKGRRSSSDVDEDTRVYEAWMTASYKTYADLAREYGWLNKRKEPDGKRVQRAIDRHRKRVNRPSE